MLDRLMARKPRTRAHPHARRAPLQRPRGFAREQGRFWLAGLASLVTAAGSQITLAWEDKSHNETSFTIERAAQDLAFTEIAVVPGDIITYIDTTVQPSTPYWYRIRAHGPVGDSAYSNIIVANTTALYFGASGGSTFIAAVESEDRRGTLYVALSSSDEVAMVPLAIGNDRSFRATVPMSDRAPPRVTPALKTLTVQGRILDGLLSGTIEELGRSFSASLQSHAGSTAMLAGIYHVDTLLSAARTTHLIVTAQGGGYVIADGAMGATLGTGNISPDGTFAIRTTDSVVFLGTIDSVTHQVQGTLQSAEGPASDSSGIRATAERTNRLANLSARLRLGGDRSSDAHAGFVIAGAGSMEVLLRAIGPVLSEFGVQNPARDPTLQLFDGAAQELARNDDWATAEPVRESGNRVGAFPLTPGSVDAALVANLPAGAYTLQIGNKSGGGVALVEVYDVGPNSGASGIKNISVRAAVRNGEDNLIGGFVISGNAPQRILVRGVGPTLNSFGIPDALADPVLQLWRDTTVIARNDNWESPQTTFARTAASAMDLSAAARQVGAFPLPPASADAALLITLAPGSYTAELTGASGTSGVAVVEIYALPNE